MATRTFIEVTVWIVSKHSWPEAPDRVSFLRHEHRHRIKIVASKEVTRLDREIEFFLFQEELNQAIHDLYPNDELGIVNLGNRSCEIVANDLVEKLNLSYCSVSEDGENRAIVTGNSYYDLLSPA